MLTLSPESNPRFFQALVGSSGLLGIITSITLQLQRIASSSVDVTLRPAASLSEILTIFQEEQSADFLEAWVDGFAEGRHLGRGIVTSTKYSDSHETPFHMINQESTHSRTFRITNQFKLENTLSTGTIVRPAVKNIVRIANSVMYRLSTWLGIERLFYKDPCSTVPTIRRQRIHFIVHYSPRELKHFKHLSRVSRQRPFSRRS